MASKVLIFAYGLLQPGPSQPRSTSQTWPDRVRGRMVDLGAYPAAVELDQGNAWIEGYTLEIDVDELPTLDEFEDVDGGEFQRRIVTTGRGFTAYAYEYQKPLPPDVPTLKRWPATKP